jgi:hypothetical protein
MSKKEHRDIYIAAAVGGVALILIWLYLSSETPTGSPLTQTAGPQTPYNYNVGPYTGQPANIQLGGVSSGQCCDKCGPNNGQDYNNVTASQFQALNQGGA